MTNAFVLNKPKLHIFNHVSVKLNFSKNRILHVAVCLEVGVETFGRVVPSLNELIIFIN